MIERIKQVIEYSQLSSTAFADTIGISRSGLTHLLTGRNQPSLDVARKILAKYPEISTEWLIMGMGGMMRAEDPSLSSEPNPAGQETVLEHPAEDSIKGMQTDLFGEFPILEETDADVLESAAEETVEAVEEKAVTANTVTGPAETVIPPEPVPAEVREAEAPVRVQTASPRSRKVSESRPAPVRRERPAAPVTHERKLQKIVFFYDDHSFEVYSNL